MTTDPTTSQSSNAHGPVVSSSSDEEKSFVTVRRLTRNQFPNVYKAFVFLPKEKRDAVCTLLSFSNLIQQAVAAVHTPDEVDAVLELFPQRIDEIFAGKIELPKPEFRDDSQHVLAAMMLVVKRYEIPKQLFIDRLEACRIDANVTRYPTYSSLEKFLDRSVGSVAMMLAAVLGLTHSDGWSYVKDLGRAIGLLGVLINLRSDRDRGKIYLPIEDLAKFRYSERDLGEGKINEPFMDLVRFELNRVRDYLDRSTEGIPWLADDGSRVCAAAFVTHGRVMSDLISQKNFDLFSAGLKLTTFQKFRLLPAIRRVARTKAKSS